MKVAFKALVKQMKIRSLVSGDKEAEMILRFLPTDEMLDSINRLHKADDDIYVVLMDKGEDS